jgi:hypothetical protein
VVLVVVVEEEEKEEEEEAVGGVLEAGSGECWAWAGTTAATRGGLRRRGRRPRR